MSQIKEVRGCVEAAEVSGAHLLQGVTIEHNGGAIVAAYFKPSSTGTTIEGHDILEANFRGRHLKGVSLPLPDGFGGAVITHECSASGEGAEHAWVATNKFSSLYYWNHDTAPQKNDGIRRCLEWAELSQQIHKPIDPSLVVPQEAGS